MRNPIDVYIQEAEQRSKSYPKDKELMEAANEFRIHTCRVMYSYNLTWAGVPIIQTPWDIQAFQELVWKVKPEVIIETGIAFGGSLMLSSTMLGLLEDCSIITEGVVVGIDIDIREHNRIAIENHPLSKRIHMMEGSSTDQSILSEVSDIASGKKTLVCLDSNHTHEHVLEELKLYTPLVSKESYCIVYDTGIAEIPEDKLRPREWNRHRNPKSAVNEFLTTTSEFEIDSSFDEKYLIPAATGGYLRRTHE